MIEELKNRPVLIGILLLLLLLNFVFVPALGWQNQVVDQISLLQQQEAKQRSHIARFSEYSAKIEQLESIQQQLNTSFYEQQSSDAFQLEMQTRIEQWVDNSGLRLRTIGWDQAVEYDGYLEFRLQLSVQGTVPQFQRLHKQLDSQSLRVEVEEMRLIVQRASKDNLGRVQGRFVLHFYMRNDSTGDDV